MSDQPMTASEARLLSSRDGLQVLPRGVNSGELFSPVLAEQMAIGVRYQRQDFECFRTVASTMTLARELCATLIGTHTRIPASLAGVLVLLQERIAQVDGMMVQRLHERARHADLLALIIAKGEAP